MGLSAAFPILFFLGEFHQKVYEAQAAITSNT